MGDAFLEIKHSHVCATHKSFRGLGFFCFYLFFSLPFLDAGVKGKIKSVRRILYIYFFILGGGVLVWCFVKFTSITAEVTIWGDSTYIWLCLICEKQMLEKNSILVKLYPWMKIGCSVVMVRGAVLHIVQCLKAFLERSLRDGLTLVIEDEGCGCQRCDGNEDFANSAARVGGVDRKVEDAYLSRHEQCLTSSFFFRGGGSRRKIRVS